jgi:hypothetical protein
MEIHAMSTYSRSELDDRIAILRDNIRQLVEQAAAQGGAADDEHVSLLLEQQNNELESLIAQRDALGPG